MSKVISAYIAHGQRPVVDGKLRNANFPLDADYRLQWKRVFCLFSIIKTLFPKDEPPRLVLISDHSPPEIDGRMIGFHIERIGVEFHRIDHVWRSHNSQHTHEFFIFDVFEYLQEMTRTDDEILIFSGKSLVVNSLDQIFSELKLNSVLFAEESCGELGEGRDLALNREMAALREEFAIGFPANSIRAASIDFIGMTQFRLTSLVSNLRKIFMKNILRALRNEDHFKSAQELLAGLLAQDQFYHSHLTGLSDHAAAMPDDFLIASLSDIPVIIPGYGREPDIAAIFNNLIGDQLYPSVERDRDTIFQLLRNEGRIISFNTMLSSMFTGRNFASA